MKSKETRVCSTDDQRGESSRQNPGSQENVPLEYSAEY